MQSRPKEKRTAKLLRWPCAKVSSGRCDIRMRHPRSNQVLNPLLSGYICPVGSVGASISGASVTGKGSTIGGAAGGAAGFGARGAAGLFALAAAFFAGALRLAALLRLAAGFARRFIAVFALPAFFLSLRLLLPAVRFFFIATTPKKFSKVQDTSE